MVDGVVEGVLLDPGQRAHPVVDASGRWVFDEGDRLKKPLKPGLGLNTLTSEMWFWSEEWGEMRHKDQVAKSGTYTNPITGKEFQGAPLGRGQVNIKRNTGMDIFSYVQPGPVDEPYRVITSYSDGRPDEIHWASGRTAQIVGDFDLTRPARDNVVVIPPSRGTPGQKTSTVSTRDDLQYPGAHPTVSAEGEWVSDDRDPEAGGLDRVVVSAPGGVREPWEYRPPSSGSESYFGAPGDLWSGMVDWWFSHGIPTEGLPSGGGLMVGPLEMAKLGNFLKDALLPLMAGDIGLAGVGGLGPFDPLPLPFGKVIGEGVKGAKAGVRAVRGAVRGADEAVEAAARTVDQNLSLRTSTRYEDVLVDAEGRPFSPDDDIIVYHVTSRENALAFQEGGIQMGGKPTARPSTIIESEDVAEMLGKEVGDTLDYEPRRGLGPGLYVSPRSKNFGGRALDDTVIGIRVKVSDIEVAPELLTPGDVFPKGVIPPGYSVTPARAYLLDDGYITRDISPDDIVSLEPTGNAPVAAAGGVARETGEAGLRVPMGERRVYPGAMSESGQAPWVDFVLSPAGGAADDMWGKPGRWAGREWGEGEWVPDEVFGEFDTNADAVIHQLESILGTDETLVGFDMAKDLAFDAGDIDAVFEIEQIIDDSVMKQARMLENPARETVFRLKKELQLYKMMADETPGGLPEWLGNGGVGTDGAPGVEFTADWQDRFMEFIMALGDEPEIFGLVEDDLYRAVGARRPRLWTGEHAFPREELGGVAREAGEAVARTDAGPWTQKLLDADAQRQAGIDAGRPRSIQALSETIDVTGIQPHGEIIINYNHPWYSAHGERTAALNWGMKMDPMAPIPLEFVRSMPLERRVRWSMPVMRKVKQVADEMTAEGITVVAEVALDRPDLLRLYERAGFVRVPRESMRHQGGREGMVEMVRRPDVPAEPAG